MTTQTVQGRAPRERGLWYGVLGGAAITLVSVLIGGALFTWLLLAASGPSAPELLPADTQLYAALAPNVGGVVEVEQLRQALREGFGVAEPAALLGPIERLLGVPLEGNVGTWLGSEIAVAVRGFDPAGVAGGDAAAALLRDSEVLFLFGSKNDPQAAGFLEQLRAAREAAGAQVITVERGEVTLYAVQGGPPSPVAAFALIDHYLVFSNSLAALEAMAAAGDAEAATLSSAAGFAQFQATLTPRRPSAVFTDGTPAAESARAALRELLRGL